MTINIKKIAITTGAALTLLSASYAMAFSGFIIEYVYYSDASRTQIVGESVQRCDDTLFVTGTITP